MTPVMTTSHAVIGGSSVAASGSCVGVSLCATLRIALGIWGAVRIARVPQARRAVRV
jgi:hypothetical protein